MRHEAFFSPLQRGGRRVGHAAGTAGRRLASPTVPGSSPNLRGRVDLRQAVWEREMRRVALSIRLFLSLVVALGARIAFAGLDLTSGVAVIVAIALLLASLYLARLVHQQRPVPRRTADRSDPRARRGDGERH